MLGWYPYSLMYQSGRVSFQCNENLKILGRY
jgi:hypothetical protein